MRTSRKKRREAMIFIEPASKRPAKRLLPGQILHSSDRGAGAEQESKCCARHDGLTEIALRRTNC
jgi:hypothetical protein